jgi:hypothetical protein
MTTVEREPDRPTATTTGPTTGPVARPVARPVAEPVAPVAPVAATRGVRERFGGTKLGAAFFGWLVAVGMTVLLTGLVALVVAAIGRNTASVPFLADAASVGLTGMATVVAVLAIAYLAGGYVAGRLARFDGARNGLFAWALGLLVTLLAGAAAAVVGASTDVATRVQLPAVPVDVTAMTVSGAILLALIVIVTALAAALGGRLGERFHRRVDRAAGLDLKK